ncbi:hypothetical protein [Aliarcobacter butzleri]|uniref:hypothetical protein n=1 Tax=Aliarcobacter butzleri TaxID=28197 RepID=UPI00263DD59B|nr:hypothetical protein [Aliarcobacter butzleri]MDN5049563.1 hypothetical protein [Aliarcobacter butzleri]MDN5056634.1 hypothetical protein [Aliarcobacter butzleri]
MNKCSCGNCGLEVFENSDKCILHCDKTKYHKKEDTILGLIEKCEDSVYYKFYETLIQRYRIFNKKLLQLIDIHFPSNILESKFPEFISQVMPNEISIIGGKFYGREMFNVGDKNYVKFDKLNLFKVETKYEFNIFNSSIKEVKLSCCSFELFKIQNSYIEDLNILGSLSAIDYWNTKNIFLFDSNINYFKITNLNMNIMSIQLGEIKNAIFKDLIINNANFEQNVFLYKLDFLDIKIKIKIDLQNAIIPEISTFLGLEFENDSGVSNRETARKIKNSFEKQNNIIEANKFYALEMKEREKELEEDIKDGKNFFEWLVFKIHGLSSNHSQDWTLALFWILSFTFTFLTMEFVNTHYLTHTVDYILIDMIIFLGFVYGNYLIIEYEKINKFLYIGIYYIFYGFFSQDWLLKCFSNKLNPFSIMTGNEELTFSGLIYKIIIAYLIYQLIISIRQNTRRK